VEFYDDLIPDYDSIYYDFLPHEWATPIEKSTVTVTLPGADTDVSGAEFIAGASGAADVRAFKSGAPVIDAENDTVTITAALTHMLALKEGMTFLLVLPEGFFAGELTDHGVYVFMWMVILVPLVILFLLWFLFGHGLRIVEPVEFYPPEGLNPAAIGYLVDGKVDDKDLLSMILFWASQGYLTIEEPEKEKFLLRRTEKDLGDMDLITWDLFDALFHFSDTVDIGKRNKKFIWAMRDVRRELIAEYDKSTGGLFEGKPRWPRVLGVFVAMIPFIGYHMTSSLLGTGWESTMVVGNVLFILLMAFVLGFVVSLLYAFRFFLAQLRFLWIFILLPVTPSVLSLLAWLPRSLASGELSPSGFIALCASLVSTAVCIYISFHVQRKTDYYSILLGRIKGFKNFIKTAEMDRLRVLFDDDPEYFYHILPYAWVFGLSDKWAEKFEKLAAAAPSWYAGYYDGRIFTTSSLTHSLRRYEKKAAGRFSSVPMIARAGSLFSGVSVSSSGGGGSFSGGGGSFSGGGGSSGGGSGGGGGGSW
jgi:hypothetical protein